MGRRPAADPRRHSRRDIDHGSPILPNIWLLIVVLSMQRPSSFPRHRTRGGVEGDAGESERNSCGTVFSMCSDIGAIIGPLVAGLWLTPCRIRQRSVGGPP